MEYVYFSGFVALIIVLCAVAARGSRPRVRENSARHDRSVATAPTVAAGSGVKPPAPWGWPGSAMHFPEGRLDTAGDWASRLLARKRTVDDESYRVRSRASLQAMVEDRFATPTTARRAERENAGPQASGSRKRARFAAGRVAGVRKPWGW